MLPSRGIVRMLPPAQAHRQISRQVVSPRAAHGIGRQFGTLRRGTGSSLSAVLASRTRPRQYAAPIGLGTVAASRSLSIPGLSLWGYGNKTNPEAAVTAADPSTTAQAVVGQTPDPSAASIAPEALSTPPPTDATSFAADQTQAGLAEISDYVNSGAAEILSREEGIGYLSSLGLDFGIGPTSLMQWALEHIHVWTGLGWAGSIIALAFGLRAIMFYPQVKGTIFGHHMRAMQEDPRYKETMSNYQKALASGDTAAMQQTMFLTRMLRQEYDASPKKVIWNFLPIPFSFGMFRLLTGMTHIPVPALETAGWAWFTDLTVSDPYMVLPALATAFMVLSLRANQKNQTAQQQAMMRKIGYFAVPAMIFATSFLSAAVNLMGTAFGFATLVTTYVLNMASVRRALGIPLHKPQVASPVEAAATPRPQYTTKAYTPEGVKERLESGIDDIKKGWSDSMSKVTGTSSLSQSEKAEKKRKEDAQKLEDKRRQSQRAQFEQKYKGRR